MDKKKDGGPASLSRRSFVAALASLPFLSFATSQAEAASFNPFSFVYVNDIHLCNGIPDNGYKMLQESQLFLQEIIKGINVLKPDFVIFGGDQVETLGKDEANWNFFLDIAQGLHAPWYFVLGEQDVVNGRLPTDKMKQFGPDFKGRGITGSDPFWSADPVTNVHLIGLDTSVANSTSGDISESQLEWLKKDLAANRGKFTILATHHPLLPPAPYDSGPPFDDYILPNGADVREILSSDVKLVLSGHLYINKAQVEKDAYHISCSGLNVFPCQYKYFRVSKDAVAMESFDVPLPKLVKKAEESLMASSLANKINRRKPAEVIELFRGQDADQNAILSLVGPKSIKPISKKQVKEDQGKRDEELEKQAELARNKGGKGKKGDDKKDSKKSDDKKSDDKKSDDKKSNDKKSEDKKSDDKKSDSKKSDDKTTDASESKSDKKRSKKEDKSSAKDESAAGSDKATGKKSSKSSKGSDKSKSKNDEPLKDDTTNLPSNSDSNSKTPPVETPDSKYSVDETKLPEGKGFTKPAVEATPDTGK